jgi:3-methylcrotonyl-CoA carboxylase beta subunit
VGCACGGRSPTLRTPPAYDPEEILDVVPAGLTTPYDIREVIARIVDDSWFDEFKPRFGETIVTGFAEVMGLPVGIVANNGVLFPRARRRRRISSNCAQRKVPLVFLQNITGFMVGRQIRERGDRAAWREDGDGGRHDRGAEDHDAGGRLLRGGELRHGGAGLRPRFLWTWPNSRISVMGGAQAAGVLATVKRAAMEKAGETGAQRRRPRSSTPTIDMFEEQSHPLYASARLWDDGIVDPRKSREVLALSLSAALNAPIGETRFGVFRM